VDLQLVDYGCYSYAHGYVYITYVLVLNHHIYILIN